MNAKIKNSQQWENLNVRFRNILRVRLAKNLIYNYFLLILVHLKRTESPYLSGSFTLCFTVQSCSFQFCVLLASPSEMSNKERKRCPGDSLPGKRLSSANNAQMAKCSRRLAARCRHPHTQCTIFAFH